jgi:hypothetical protein
MEHTKECFDEVEVSQIVEENILVKNLKTKMNKYGRKAMGKIFKIIFDQKTSIGSSGDSIPAAGMLPGSHNGSIATEGKLLSRSRSDSIPAAGMLPGSRSDSIATESVENEIISTANPKQLLIAENIQHEARYYMIVLFFVLCLFASESVGNFVALLCPAVKTFYIVKSDTEVDFLKVKSCLCYWMLIGLFYGVGFLFDGLSIPFISFVKIIFSCAMIQSDFAFASTIFNLVAKIYDSWSSKNTFEEILTQISKDFGLK